jgi:hypothetical protein
MATDNTVVLVHVASHGYILQQLCVEQLLRFSMICTVVGASLAQSFLCLFVKKKCEDKFPLIFQDHLERIVTSD